MPKNHIIVGLDIGTNFIKALAVASKPESQRLEVLGKVESPSFGVRKGVVVNIGKVSKIIEQSLAQLQADIGQKIEDVYINIGGSHIFSTISNGTVVVSRADQKISEEDVSRVIQAAQAFSLPLNREILDIFPREFIVDGQGQIKEPLDMRGLKLEAEVLLLCGFAPYLKNLTTTVLNADYQISNITPSPLASAASVLTSQQKELGVCLVDIGGGTTDLAIYAEGDLIHVAIFPIGSSHITNDIAIGLRVDIEMAERIKREFGTCIFSGSNKKEKIELSQELEAVEPLTFSHKMLAKIIEARVSEIFSLIQKELKQVFPQGLLPAGVVLTGGGVKLPKIIDFAKKELKLPVQIGTISGLVGIEQDTCLSVVCGLVLGGAEDLETKNWRNSSFGQVLGAKIGSKLKRIFKIFIP